jgi:hypothetical protein
MKERSNVERAAEGFGVSEKLELLECLDAEATMTALGVKEITREQILHCKIEERLAARSPKNGMEKGRSDGRLPSLATGKIRLAASTEWGSENPGETRQARC